MLSFKLRGTESLNFVVPINYVRGLLATPESMSLQEFQQRLGKAPNLFDTTRAAPVRSRWKSLASGTTKIVRQEGDHLYVETVLPEQESRAGAFQVAELRKTGEVFVGVTRHSFSCVYDATDWNTLGTKQVVNRCTTEGVIQIRLFSPSRIEGVADVYPQGTKFNCKKCSYSAGPVKASFTWIPE